MDQLELLVDAVLQVLDDMGDKGLSCCGLAKADLRIAVEPFLHGEAREWATQTAMDLDEARRIRREVDGST